MHRCRGGAEPFAVGGEVTADLVGVQVALGVEVAHAGRGQPPAVAGVGHERLQHRHRGRGSGRVGVVDLDVAEQRCDVLVLRRPQGVEDLDVRVQARLEPAEELEDRLGPVDQRGVALLAGDDVAGQALGDVGDAGRVEVHRPDGGGVHQVDQPRRGRVPVAHRVVGVGLAGVARHRAHERRLEVLGRVVAPGQRHEVGLAVPVGVGDPDPVHREDGVAAVEEEAVLGDVGPLPALAAEPALVGHPLAEQVGEHLHRGSPSASGALSPGVSSAALTTPAASSESATELEVAWSQSSCSSGAGSAGRASSNQ